MLKHTFALLILMLLLASCNKNQHNEKPIAQIGNKSLYLSDIADIFNNNINREDSINLLTDYVNRWARKQLILKLAESNLVAKEKDLSTEIENYRASLLIFKYEKAYVTQRMDTVVRQSELENFYNENGANFQLVNPLVKALYIKVPNDAPIIKEIRDLYRSTSDEKMEELESICYQGVTNFDYFNGEWIDFTILIKELPSVADIKNLENELINKQHIETSDKQFTYFVSIHDIKLKGTAAPFEHVKENIKDIILNKRKQDIIKKLEKDIYNEALNRKELIINIGK